MFLDCITKLNFKRPVDFLIFAYIYKCTLENGYMKNIKELQKINISKQTIYSSLKRLKAMNLIQGDRRRTEKGVDLPTLYKIPLDIINKFQADEHKQESINSSDSLLIDINRLKKVAETPLTISDGNQTKGNNKMKYGSDTFLKLCNERLENTKKIVLALLINDMKPALTKAIAIKNINLIANYSDDIIIEILAMNNTIPRTEKKLRDTILKLKTEERKQFEARYLNLTEQLEKLDYKKVKIDLRQIDLFQENNQ